MESGHLYDDEFPYLSDKNALIPVELFDVAPFNFMEIISRSHTMYLDPAFTLSTTEHYPRQPHVALAMYETPDNLGSIHGYGAYPHKLATEAAIKLVGNNRSPKFYEEYIRAIHNDPPLRLVHILAVREFNSLGSFVSLGWLSPNSPIYNLHAG